jgi:hypothetical protein
MKICLTTPNRFGQNGGLKLINDFYKQLLLLGHDVYLMDENAIKTHERILTPDGFRRHRWGLVICCSPHSVWSLWGTNVERGVVWAQMAEHMWSKSRQFTERCNRFYNHETVICNAQWLLEFMPKGKVCRTWLQEDFQQLNNRTKYDILLESPFSKNPTKDSLALAYRAALNLKEIYSDVRIAGYGRQHFAQKTINKYVVAPAHNTLEHLYSQSRLLFKATKYDGASCSPIEAAKYGCVTVRALDKGDDWLTNENAYRCEYNEKEYFDLVEKAFIESRHDYHDSFATKQRLSKEFIKQWTFENFINEFSRLTNIPELIGMVEWPCETDKNY